MTSVNAPRGCSSHLLHAGSLNRTATALRWRHSSFSGRLLQPARFCLRAAAYHRGMPPIDAKRDSLLAALRQLESCAVAFSGGVDSAVVAKAAAIALGDSAVAVTGTSASLAAGELEAA